MYKRFIMLVKSLLCIVGGATAFPFLFYSIDSVLSRYLSKGIYTYFETIDKKDGHVDTLGWSLTILLGLILTGSIFGFFLAWHMERRAGVKAGDSTVS